MWQCDRSLPCVDELYENFSTCQISGGVLGVLYVVLIMRVPSPHSASCLWSDAAHHTTQLLCSVTTRTCIFSTGDPHWPSWQIDTVLVDSELSNIKAIVEAEVFSGNCRNSRSSVDNSSIRSAVCALYRRVLLAGSRLHLSSSSLVSIYWGNVTKHKSCLHATFCLPDVLNLICARNDILYVFST